MAANRSGLLLEIVAMSLDTLRTSKMRSALTVLGVVIGITSIVGMTSLIRGFDESLRDSIRALGPNTVFVQKFSALSFASGKSFLDLAKRPNITRDDARAVAEGAPSIGVVDVWLGGGPGDQSRVFYGHQKTKQISILGATENFSAVNFIKLDLGRLFTPGEVEHRRQVVVLGQNPYLSLFPNVDPIGKKVRIGSNEYTVIGVFGKRPSPGGFGGADDFVVVPFTVQEKFYGKVAKKGYTGGNVTPAAFSSAMIAIVPREDATREQAMLEAESIMRIRHNLKLDEPNDFDLVTQDAILKVWDQFSQATFLGAGRHQLDRADGRRHRRDGDHDDLGHRAHPRDRRPQGARRAPARDPLAVPDRSGVPDLARRPARHPVRQRHRPGRPLDLRLPDLAAVVVVRPRHRLLGRRRHLLRPRPGGESRPHGSDRSTQIRMS